jgi:hypothetical protein
MVYIMTRSDHSGLWRAVEKSVENLSWLVGWLALCECKNVTGGASFGVKLQSSCFTPS